MKRIFLTFDDGVQEGTIDVIRSLKKYDIKASFFIAGINTLLYTKNNKQNTLKMLTEGNHVLCNHSFSHANDSFKEYYEQGLCVNKRGQRISILDDFVNNTSYLRNLMPGYGFDHLSSLARLPGRNSWFLQSSNGKIKNAYFDSDSRQATMDLAKAGFRVFGWDDEWKMNFDFIKLSRSLKKSFKEEDRVKYSIYDLDYPDIDMSNQEFSKYDRVLESWETLASRIMSNKKSNIVLLLHERAFRKDNSCSSINSLDFFLEYLLDNNILFDTLNNY